MKIDKYGVAHFYDGGDGGGGDPSGGDSGGGSSGAGGDGSMGFGIEGGSYGGAGYGNVGYGGAGDVSPDALASIAAANIASSWGSPGGREARGALDALEQMGYGKMEGINAANPTQTVDNLLASANTAWALENVAVPALMAAVPGANTAMALGKGIAGLASGQISVGQSIANTAISLAASQIGVPAGSLAAAINGNYGQVAANTAMGAVNSAIASLTGIPAGLVGIGMNVSGLGRAGNEAITGAINQATGATPTDNVAALGRSIDAALGMGPGTTGGFGYSFDATGQPAFDFSGSDGTPAPATPASATQAPASQRGSNAAAAIATLGALGFQEDDTQNEYKVAEVPVTSPFGQSPYGAGQSLPYGMRG